MKQKMSSQSGTKLAAVNPELVFRRALVISEYRDDLSLEKVMSYPIGAVPSSMFHEDGTIRTNANSELTSVLKNHAALVCEISAVPSKTVYIRDAMALIQIIDGNQQKHLMI